MSNIFSINYRSSIKIGIYLVLAALAVIFFIYLSFVYGIGFGNYRMASLEIEIGQNNRVFIGRVVNGMTVLDAINASVAAGHINFKYSINGIDNKLEIASLDGYTSSDKNADLEIYINDSKINVEEIHMLAIKPGDTITIKSK